MSEYVIRFEELSLQDVERVGGKNASLGELIANLTAAGVNVPTGFATTSDAYREFLSRSGLQQKIQQTLDELDVSNISDLLEAGKSIRDSIMAASLQPELEQAILQAYRQLTSDGDNSVAVRSSATAEDLPDASFAGQQETYLNVSGEAEVLMAVKRVFASLFNDRAISYRVHQGYEHEHVALSAGIQRMVRSDLACSGVMFTLDTESGFSDAVLINAAYGLGETVVQGEVNPDEFYLYKPALEKGKPSILRRKLGSKALKMIYTDQNDSEEFVKIVEVPESERKQFCLTDEEQQALARQALLIEKHYGRPMDIEWAKDGLNNNLYIVQARPETVQSRTVGQNIIRYKIIGQPQVIVSGASIGQKIATGMVRLVDNVEQLDRVKPGDILVTDMTDPDWEPVMKIAAAIVTNRGGRTCHAAIIARELGVPAVVGVGNATELLTEGQAVSVSCGEGETGFVYEGIVEYEVQEIQVGNMPELPIKLMMNVGNPERAFHFSQIPNAGVGLARLEFIINNMIGIHPKALLNYDSLSDSLRKEIDNRISAYGDPIKFYVDKLVEGISTLAAAFYPRTVIVRMSDFKSNEYANLVGGELYEPIEENPMLGFRGATRYISEDFRACFELECRALNIVRNEMGLDNIQVMIPFVRKVDQAKQVIELLAENGLQRGIDGLKVIMMCEVPSNAILAEEFLEYFDGFSIGSNDLTQMTLGLDRDSGLLSDLFDERDPAIKALLKKVISVCNKAGKYVGICGQGPSDYPDFARWLMEEDIGSISLNPDSIVETWMHLASEQK